MYKNCIDKDPGVNTPLIHWMSKECERTGTAKEGGIIFYEMVIQAGVQFQPCGEGLKMYGYVECGPYNNGMQDKGNKDTDMPLATYVLQFVFLAYNAFRFPFSYMLTRNMNADKLTAIFWDIMTSLKLAGFRITFTCMDGASVNRSFLNIITRHNPPIARNLTSLNDTLSCIMDISHVVEKN